MKILFVHADALEYEAKKPALKSAPPLAPGEEKGASEECLVVFYSVEKGDEGDVAGVVAQALANVQDVARQVKPKEIVCYPYAHLSNDLARPSDAVAVGKALVDAVRGAGFVTKSSPFGWYKSFTLKAKGHPLSELSRTIKPAGYQPPTMQTAAPGKVGAAAHGPEEHQHAAPESDALKKEKKLVSHWYVLTPQGDLIPASEFEFFGHPEFAAFHKHETQGSRAAPEEPAHVKMMREMELVDYEPGSDPGNFRWYPKGQLVKRLMEEHVSNLVADAGGMRVETPIMYDYEHPALKKYLDRFPARQYVLKSEDKEFFLRFAACFGQYLIGHDMTISYKQLPIRLYELTHYSFRREQRGELAGLRRLRTFTMPDMHTMVKDVAQAKEEFARQFDLSMQWMDALGVPYNAGVRFVRSFFEENREFAVSLARKLGKPMLVEMWDDRFFYFVMKFEFNVVDAQGKAAALSTVQIDVENTERFGITYADETGAKKHPLLLHASLSGSIDRNLYAILEWEARRAAKGEKPMLPFWLAPTQVRFCAVSEKYVDACIAMAASLRAATGARVDVDDRDLGVGRKIRDAEQEWIPLVVVYGEKEHAAAEAAGSFERRRTEESDSRFVGREKEAGSNEIPVRVRATGEQRAFTADALAAFVRDAQGGRPLARLPLPERLSARPTFRG